MESLNETLPTDSKGNGPLDNALDEVNRLGRNVRELVEYASPPYPMPLRCTATEIAIAARNSLPIDVRGRVVLARISADGSIHTDAPLLTQCLRRLVENAIEAGSDQVLLVVRRENGHTSFSVIDGAASSFDADWALEAFNSTKRNHLGLGLAIAHRDVEALGGTLELLRSPQNETSVVVTIPDAAASEHGNSP